MKEFLKLEELIQFVAAISLFHYLEYDYWKFWAFLLLPDLSMIGYLAGNKVGAVLYNIFHHKGIALALLGVAYYFEMEALAMPGIILYAHSCMDRIFGFGLKYVQGFNYTHLGVIGKENKSSTK